jgi:hypothetical protein
VQTYVSGELLSQLQRRGDWIQRLEALWRQHVDGALIAHSRPISYRSGRLLVQVDASIWGDRIRQQQQRLMQALRQHDPLIDLRELRVQIAPVSEDAPGGKSPRPDRLSAASAALLNAAAGEIEDPRLREALQRLSTHRERQR